MLPVAAAVKVNAIASTVTAVLSAEPKARVPEPFGSMVIFELPAEVVISITPAEVISIPPADAFNVIASATASFEDKFTDDPVADISISSPAAASLASISTPPALASITIAAGSSLLEPIFTSSAPSISTPPAVAVNVSAPEPVPCVFVTTIVSLVPILVVKEIAEAASSFETRAT